MNEEPASKKDIEQVRQDMQAMETRLEQKMEAMETRLEQKMEASETRLEQKIERWETRLLDRITELMRDFETRLLTPFHGYGKGQALEDRVLNLETGHGPRPH